MENESVNRLLSLIAKYDDTGALWWNENLQFYVICSDVFSWGTADLEPISEETLADLEKAYEDGGDWGAELYCARRRKKRPQGAFYDDIDEDVWHLFDACGPERDLTEIGNMPRSEKETSL